MRSKTTERDIETAALTLLSALGCEHATIGGARPQGQRGYVGNTLGIPDKIVRHRTWPRGCWMALEFKRDESSASAMMAQTDSRGIHQTRIWNSGGSWIVWKPEQAIEAFIVMNTALSMPNHAAVTERAKRILHDRLG